MEWCKRTNHKPVSNTNFGRQLNELRIEEWKNTNGCIFYRVPRMEDFDIISYLRIQNDPLLPNMTEGLEAKTACSTECSTAQNPLCKEVTEGTEGCISEKNAQNPLPDSVTEGTEGLGGGLIKYISAPDFDPSEKQPMLQSSPQGPPEAGDIVVIVGTAHWIRHGSDKLPWQDVPKKMRSQPEVPIAALGNRLQRELLDEHRVLNLSRDRQRVRARNQETGRTSVFKVSDVQVLRKGVTVDG